MSQAPTQPEPDPLDGYTLQHGPEGMYLAHEDEGCGDVLTIPESEFARLSTLLRAVIAHEADVHGRTLAFLVPPF